jgi:segregation and condensation protein B
LTEVSDGCGKRCDVGEVPEHEVDDADEAAPEDVIAEGSGPHDAHELAAAFGRGRGGELDADDESAGDELASDESAGNEVAGDEVAGDEVAGDELAADDGAEAVAAALPTSAASMDDEELVRLLEALVFASDKPVTLARLRQLTRIADTARLEAAVARLGELLAERGIVLAQVSGGYQLRTASRFAHWVQQLIAGRPVRLSRAQLETLAIIAYRQPITRPEIDEIRGVDSSNTLRVLAERQLVRVLGKREEVGRPLLYGTTKEFLDFFSLADLRELPTLREYSELSAESREVVEARLNEVEADAQTDAVGGADQ